MRNFGSWTKWAGLGAIAVVSLAGCTEQQEAAVDSSGDMMANTASTADDAMANAADNTGDAMANAADNAGDAMENGVAAVGNALEPAVVTPNVKEALGDDKSLEGSSIDVDTNGETNTVMLKGTVMSEAQKTAAEAIAKREAQGYTVDTSMLTVQGS